MINFVREILNNLTLLVSPGRTLKIWITILFIIFKLDYMDYYCYGISTTTSDSSLLNNENGELPSDKYPLILGKKILDNQSNNPSGKCYLKQNLSHYNITTFFDPIESSFIIHSNFLKTTIIKFSKSPTNFKFPSFTFREHSKTLLDKILLTFFLFRLAFLFDFFCISMNICSPF